MLTLEKLLESQDPDFNKQDADGNTYLHIMADRNGFDGFIEWLIERGANANLANRNNVTALKTAMWKKNITAAEKLIEYTYISTKSLSLAISEGYTTLAKKMIDKCDPSQLDTSILESAIRVKQDEIVEILKGKGISTDRNADLLRSIDKRDVKEAERLIDSGAKSSNNLLKIAVEKYEDKMFDMLITKNFSRKEKSEALFEALNNVRNKYATKLLEHDIDPNFKILDTTIVQKAITTNNNDVLSSLIIKGANINIGVTNDIKICYKADKYGFSQIDIEKSEMNKGKQEPLVLYAARKGKIAAVKLLVESGKCDINTINYEKYSLATYYYDNYEMKEFLLKNGINPSLFLEEYIKKCLLGMISSYELRNPKPDLIKKDEAKEIASEVASYISNPKNNDWKPIFINITKNDQKGLLISGVTKVGMDKKQGMDFNEYLIQNISKEDWNKLADYQKNQKKNQLFREFAEENEFTTISNENVFNQDTETIYVRIEPIDNSLLLSKALQEYVKFERPMEASCILCAHDFGDLDINAEQQFEMPVMGM